MTLLGNILLGLSALVYLIFSFETLGRPIPGGDRGVGFAFVLLLNHGLLLIFTGIVAWIIASKGGFAWVAATSGKRFLLVAGGLLLAVLGSSVLSSHSIAESRLLSALLSFCIPGLLIAGLWNLLNSTEPTTPLQRAPLVAAAGLGALLCLPSLLMRFRISTLGGAYLSHVYHQLSNIPDESHLGMIKTIEETDVSKGLLPLLMYTGSNQHRKVREAALMKIKTRPDWQQEIAGYLRQPDAAEAFTFLAASSPDDVHVFAEPVHDGIRVVAANVRKTLGRARSDERLWTSFSSEIQRILATVKKMEGNGQDYRPDMQELRDAFNAPCQAINPKFPALPDLDKWLKQH